MIQFFSALWAKKQTKNKNNKKKKNNNNNNNTFWLLQEKLILSKISKFSALQPFSQISVYKHQKVLRLIFTFLILIRPYLHQEFFRPLKLLFQRSAPDIPKIVEYP